MMVDRDRLIAVAVFVVTTIFVVAAAIYMWPAEKTITEEVLLGDGPVLSSVPAGAKDLSPRDFRSLAGESGYEFVGILFVGVGKTSVYFIPFARLADQLYFVQAERGISIRSSFSYVIDLVQISNMGGEVKAQVKLVPRGDRLLSYFVLGSIWTIISAMCVGVYRSVS